MEKQLDDLLNGTKYKMSILANTAAYLFEYLSDINWVGFYIANNEELYLGPFQGRSACVHIPFGKGACGRSAKEKAIIIYDDVKIVENYISCHNETQSEIVLPIIINKKIYGVLDIDSLKLSRFDENSKIMLEKIVGVVEKNLEKAI